MPDTLVNEHSPVPAPRLVRLTVSDFDVLKSAGAFAGYSKPALLDGRPWGVPAQAPCGPEREARSPIKLRIEDYRRLHESGAFRRYAKTELIDGLVYSMNPQHRPHGFAKDELAYRLRRALEAMESDLHVATEQSVALVPHDQPEPDIILTTAPRGSGAIPGESVAMIVEIAHTSLDHDLLRKAPVYASRGVAEYWVVDVNAGLIRQMWSPRGEFYAERQEVKLGDRIEAATIEGLAVKTTGIN